MALVNTKAAAAHLGIHPATLRQKVREGHIPCVRIGNTASLRFNLDAIDAHLAKQQAQPGTATDGRPGGVS